jgi:sialate O-acetylesterase
MSRGLFPFIFVWLLSTLLVCAGLPALYLIGDSTVRNSTSGQMGWGDPLVAHFDPEEILVVNRAIGGRSSRTFLTEGRWDAVMAHLKAGDFVLIQFGHNDGGKTNEGRCRASLRGTGSETEEIVRHSDGKPETVVSFGAYLNRYILDAKSKGATPIVVSPMPRNIWKEGSICRDTDGHSLWARQVAEAQRVPFIDLNRLLADAYEKLGPDKTMALFATGDHTHTNPAGAEFNASIMAGAIRALAHCSLGKSLLPGDLWMPSIFSDHMVLQREVPVRLWGTTASGTKVQVSIASNTVAVTADARGCWTAKLPPMPAGGPHRIEVVANSAKLAFSDVLVGEVWLCSGQSNMDFTLAPTRKRSFAGVTDWQREVAGANHPRIRMFTAEWTMREFPQRDVAGQWKTCTPENAADFSAVAYYFAREIESKLNMPVGLVTSAFGASTIEAWISPRKLETDPHFTKLLSDFSTKRMAFRDDPKTFADYGRTLAKWNGKGRAPRHPDPVQDQHNPFVLHNGMIAPIAPYALRGALWYQGESNLGTGPLYTRLQNALIGDWRELWVNPDMPFYFVQLAAYKAPSNDPAPGGQFASMREYQAGSLAVSHTGMAVTIDIGDEKDVHPRNKKDVGARLARLALAGTYGKSGVPCGPVFQSASITGNSIRVRFDHINGGLVSADGPLHGFAVAGDDKRFVAAQAVIDGELVVVSAPDVARPAFVRYAWADNPAGANLRNTDGLPAAPFRTDH